MKKIIWCLALCVALWASGLVWFCAQIPQAPLPDVPSADAIVVLTGGAGRIEYGLTLLAQGKGKALFISGVSAQTTVAEIVHHAPPEIQTDLLKLPTNAIALGHRAVNTIGNAEETARWVQQNHYKSLLLVTSDYHILRSLNEFHAALPGVTIFPAPVFHNPDEEKMILEYNKYLASHVRHWFMSTEKSQ